MFEMRDAVARRVARLVAGATLILGAARLVVWRFEPAGDSALVILLGAWLCAAAAYGIVRIGLWVWHPWLATRFPLWFEALSLAVPAAGIGLLAPLTLHLPVVLWLDSAAGFEAWVRISITIVGVAHVVCAGLLAVRACQIARTKTPMTWQKILGITIIAASIPWLVFLLLPPILVGVTGLVLAPAVVWLMDREGARDLDEREALAGYAALPRATIVERGHSAA